MSGDQKEDRVDSSTVDKSKMWAGRTPHSTGPGAESILREDKASARGEVRRRPAGIPKVRGPSMGPSCPLDGERSSMEAGD